MKKAFYVLLAALVVVPAYASSLNPEDWFTEAPSGCFTFENGTLKAFDNTNGKELFYKVTSETPLMTNGSGLSITLQFDNESFLNDPETAFLIQFRVNNSIYTGDEGDTTFHYLHVRNNGDGRQLNIYDKPAKDGIEWDSTLSIPSEGISTLTVDYAIKDNLFCYSYTLNGVPSDEYVFKSDIDVDPNLAWRPSFGVSNNESVIFTVTDVTFKLAPSPEPTTTTLSLLALVGLAARRRRK